MRRVMPRAMSVGKNAGSTRCGNSCTPRVRTSSQRGADAKPASNRLNGAAASRFTACAGKVAHWARNDDNRTGRDELASPSAALATNCPRHSELSSANGAGSTPCDGNQWRTSSLARGPPRLVMAFLPLRARYLAPAPLESHFQIWEIFPKLSFIDPPHIREEKHAYPRRPLQP